MKGVKIRCPTTKTEGDGKPRTKLRGGTKSPLRTYDKGRGRVERGGQELAPLKRSVSVLKKRTNVRKLSSPVLERG